VIQFYLDDVKHAIEHADFVFCNEDEADAYGKAHGVEGTDRESIAKAILSTPKKNTRRQRYAIITQGAQPVIVATQDKEGKVSIELVELEKIPKEKIVDTNGAGDSFVGGFYAALTQGKSVIEAVKAGNKLAGHVVQRHGCTFD